ncbi:MAG TPA: hypothetical protein DCE81_03760, partial [Cytophagales bacterium]|nr:hypothetical protein [Cytophagales bacterium]
AAQFLEKEKDAVGFSLICIDSIATLLSPKSSVASSEIRLVPDWLKLPAGAKRLDDAALPEQGAV